MLRTTYERLSKKIAMEKISEIARKEDEYDEQYEKMNMNKIKYKYNIPSKESISHRWIYWCYYIVKELAPYLLNNEEFNTAYNDMVSICDKYSHKLKYNKITYKYEYHRLLRLEEEDLTPKRRSIYKSYWRGHIGYFKDEPYWYSDKHEEEKRRDCNDILQYYIKVLNIIKPHIEEPMKEIYIEKSLRIDIGNVKRSIQYTIKGIDRVEKELLYKKKYLEEKMKELDELRSELNAL
jgi:hypothetical protein